MMVPKAFRIEDYKARAVHEYASRRNCSDGELLREIVSKWLEEQGYNPYDHIPPLTSPSTANR